MSKTLPISRTVTQKLFSYFFKYQDSGILFEDYGTGELSIFIDRVLYARYRISNLGLSMTLDNTYSFDPSISLFINSLSYILDEYSTWYSTSIPERTNISALNTKIKG
jgi:hypothetical protein